MFLNINASLVRFASLPVFLLFSLVPFFVCFPAYLECCAKDPYLDFSFIYVLVLCQFRVDENFNLDYPHSNCFQIFFHLLPLQHFSFKNLARFVSLSTDVRQSIL